MREKTVFNIKKGTAMKRTIAITTALLCGICVADVAQEFRVPQGMTRENTGPLFWLHGDETEARLREIGRAHV